MSIRYRFFFLGCTVLLLAACGKTVQVIPTGVQTVAGIVKPVELSLTRRGTHLLVQHGTSLYYLESSTVNMQSFEGRNVIIKGTVEQNTDPTDLPVLVVSEIKGAVTQIRSWKISGLGLSVDVPVEWNGKFEGGTAQFTGSGSADPLLTLFLEGDKRFDGASSQAGGDITVTSFALGMRRGVRLVNAGGRERVEIDLRPLVKDNAADVLTLLFTPVSGQTDRDAWEGIKTDIINSIKFTSDVSSSSAPSSSGSIASQPISGSGAGMPCGGSAGILCPQGYYCGITDAKSNSGQCRRNGT